MTDKRIRLILDSKSAKKNADDLEKSVTGVGKAADVAQFSLNKLAAAISAAIAVDKIVEYSDAFTSVQNQIKRTTSSQQELTKTTSDLLKVANDTRAGLEVTTDLYTSLTVATDGLGYSQTKLLGITKTINNLTLEGGKSAAESAGALKQLGQALQSGALRGDEFNSVAEGMPGILRALQKETGKSAAELREWAATGAITAELVVKSLESAADSAQKAANQTKATFAQNETVARNNAIAFVGASQEISAAVDLAGKSMVKLSENLDLVLKAGGVAAAFYVARLIPAVLAYSASVALATRSQLAAVPAVTGLSAALGVQARVATAATVSMNALSVAAGVARGALALLGGPVGVAFLAASALVYFVATSEKVSATLPESAKKVDELAASFENLTKAQKENQRQEWVKEAKDYKTQITVLEEQINSLKQTTLSYGLAGQGVQASTDAAIARTINEYEKLKVKLREVEGALNATTKAQSSHVPKGAPLAVPNVKTTKNTRVDSSVSDTASLQADLQLQLNLNKIFNETRAADDASYFEKKKALAERETKSALASLSSDFDKENQLRQDKLKKTIENDKVGFAERNQLTAEAEKQGTIAFQLFEQEKVKIQQKASEDRRAIAEEEAKSIASGGREIESAKMITASLQVELDQRRQAAEFYHNVTANDSMGAFDKERALIAADQSLRLAMVEQQAQEDQARRAEQIRLTLENEKLNNDAKLALKAEYDAQVLLSEQNIEAQKNAIKEEGIRSRAELDKAEYNARLASVGDLGNALMNLGQGQSKKIFKIGQTLALAQAAVALPTAVMESFKNGGGYPWGLIPAAAMAATGLKNIQQIKSAGAGLGGGGGGSVPMPSLGSGSGMSGIPTTASSTELTQQTKIFDLRGVKLDDKITVATLIDLLENDGAIVAIEGARVDAQRRNVIGVTAR